MILFLLLSLLSVVNAVGLLNPPRGRPLDGEEVFFVVAYSCLAVALGWVAGYTYYVMKKAREKGWQITVWRRLFGLVSILYVRANLIVEKQEFAATPVYKPKLSDWENLMRCIKGRKAARKREERRERRKERR